MIKDFKHKALAKFFLDNNRSGLNASHCARINRLLDRLDAAEIAEDMNLPGYGFHRLLGDRRDTWSVKISGNWRLTFKFVVGHAYEVNLEDYH